MISNERKLYLRNKKRINLFVNLSKIFILIFLFLLWELLSKFNIINSFIFSSPSILIKSLINLYSNFNLFENILVTFNEIIISTFISMLLALIISSLFWRFPILSKIFLPFITSINSLPKVALGPLIIIWIGANNNSIIFMSVLISLFISIINLYSDFTSINSNYEKMFNIFGATKFQIYKYLVIPINITNIISNLKINISMNFIGVIMGELLISKKGLGYLISYGTQVFNINLVLISIVILCFLSSIICIIIDKIKKSY